MSGTNKQPIIDFSGEHFLTTHGPSSPWLLGLIDPTARPDEGQVPLAEEMCQDVNNAQLALAKKVLATSPACCNAASMVHCTQSLPGQVNEIEKKFEGTVKSVKSSAWETVSTMMDYMSSQAWWERGPGSDFVDRIVKIACQYETTRQDFAETWGAFLAQADRWGFTGW